MQKKDRINRIGEKYNKLLIIDYGEDEISKSGKHYKVWKCKCDCGNILFVKEKYLLNGDKKSCGCLSSKNRKITHKRGNKYSVLNDCVYVEMSNCEDIMVCDIEDWEKYKKYTWSKNSHGYAYARINYKITLFHKICFPDGLSNMIDHINRNKLDNRKSNLRIVDYSQNNRNVSIKKNNKSGYTGVWFDKRNNKYSARIHSKDGKYLFLGYFDTAEEANKKIEKYKKEHNL